VTLRRRLSVAAALFAVLVVIGFGSLTHVTFGRQIELHLETLLLADLERVATLLERPSLGASFGGAGSDGVILQFVTSDGRIALWWGDEALLPLHERPTTLQRGERTYLAAQAPWRATNGTIRLAHDVTASWEARGAVTRILVASGAIVVAVATLLALFGVRRMLRPLTDLARATRRVDPSAPDAVPYRGPEDEVRDLADGLNAALEAIRSRREAERGFLLEVAHELAAPLTLVHYHLDGLRLHDPADERLRAAADAARELLRTSQDLLVVARGELEREVEYRLLDLRAVVLRVAAEYPGIGVDSGAPAAEVAGDPERLMQVVRNVVRNAVQASGATGGVRLALRTDGDAHVLAVHDTGPGMTPEARQRAFERGYTGGAGAGVGLAVARSLVERHGGTIAVAATSPAGTTIEVRLPSLASRLAPHDGDRAAPVVGTA
jgi:two-component system, OmpR family, sensor kinase